MLLCASRYAAAFERLFEVRKPKDQAMLLENFVVSELIKRYSYAGDKLTKLGNLWHLKGEIDIVAFRNGPIQHAWEPRPPTHIPRRSDSVECEKFNSGDAL
jgi:predicted AAA+ superfamily ATPase